MHGYNILSYQLGEHIEREINREVQQNFNSNLHVFDFVFPRQLGSTTAIVRLMKQWAESPHNRLFLVGLKQTRYMDQFGNLVHEGKIKYVGLHDILKTPSAMITNGNWNYVITDNLSPLESGPPAELNRHLIEFARNGLKIINVNINSGAYRHV